MSLKCSTILTLSLPPRANTKRDFLLNYRWSTISFSILGSIQGSSNEGNKAANIWDLLITIDHPPQAKTTLSTLMGFHFASPPANHGRPTVHWPLTAPGRCYA